MNNTTTSTSPTPLFTAPVTVHDDHLIFSVDNLKFVLDTGSPLTFANKSSISLLGKQYKIRTEFLQLNDKRLSKFLGMQVDGLFGADILANFDVSISLQQIQFYKQNTFSAPASSLSFDMQLVSGIPVIPIQALYRHNQQPSTKVTNTSAVFDTGAKICYVADDELVQECKELGVVPDFYPTYGTFETQSFMKKFVLVSEDPSQVLQTELKTGILPPALKSLMNIAPSAQAILSTELLKTYTVTICYHDERMYMTKLASTK